LSEQKPPQEDQTFTAQAEEKMKTVFEEIEVEGRYVMNRIQELMKEGNVRRIVVYDPHGKFRVEIPLTVAAMTGGAFALVNPMIALGGLAAVMLSRVKLEVHRNDDKGDKPSDES
jgi:hypothetical protein